MKSRIRNPLLPTALLVLSTFNSQFTIARAQAEAEFQPTALRSIETRPLAFEPAADKPGSFVARGKRAAIMVSPGEADFRINEAAIGMKLTGGSASSAVQAMAPLPG